MSIGHEGLNVWRNRGLMYRLEGVRYENDDVSLQKRPLVKNVENDESLNGKPEGEDIEEVEVYRAEAAD